MSLAKKCDVCGNLYEHYYEPGTFNSFQFINTDSANYIADRGRIMNCCPVCMNCIGCYLNMLIGHNSESNADDVNISTCDVEKNKYYSRRFGQSKT